MKKKTVKTILIAALVAVVVIAAIVLSILLREDSRGLNAFDRSKVVATAGGQSVTMGEYVMAMDNTLSLYSYYGISYTPDQAMQDDIIESLLLNKLYLVKLRELGLSLTAEELATCKQTAKDQLASIENSIGQQLVNSGNFSTGALQSRVNEYFTRTLGMTKSQYVSYVEQEQQASLAKEKVSAYYESQTKNYTDAELLAYYEDTVTKNYASDYQAGDYSSYMQMYTVGYYSYPSLYVPEGFIYVDLIQIEAATEDEINAFYAELEGGKTFEELAADSRNTASMQSAAVSVAGPYAIGEGDYAYVADYEGLFETASALEVGAVTLVIEPVTATAEDGTESTTYVGYIIRRAEGAMCENGAAFGVVDIDYYDGVRASFQSSFETSRFNEITDAWLADKWVSDAVYAYTGA